jgi:hypothetical protein
MRIAVAAALVGSVALAGCCRPWQTSAAEPLPAEPQPYGQGPYSNSYSRSYAPSSGQYGPPPLSAGYEAASPSNPLGPVPRSNSQYEYEY